MCDRRRGEELISRALPFSVDSPGGGSVTSCSQSDKKGRLRRVRKNSTKLRCCRRICGWCRMWVGTETREVGGDECQGCRGERKV